MGTFKAVNHVNDINLPNTWKDVPEFKSKNKVICFQGKYYKVIAKKERSRSSIEQIGRGFLGALIVCASLGIAVLFKTIRNLFTPKETLRFGMIHDFPTDSGARQGATGKKIKSIVVGPTLTSNPPQFRCMVTYTDNEKQELTFWDAEYQKLIADLPKKNVTHVV